MQLTTHSTKLAHCSPAGAYSTRKNNSMNCSDLNVRGVLWRKRGVSAPHCGYGATNTYVTQKMLCIEALFAADAGNRAVDLWYLYHLNNSLNAL